MIEVLRLSHRIPRDSRMTTHVALTSRAFGATKMYYSGQHDKEMVQSVMDVVKNFGGDFDVEYVKDAIKLINEKKKNGFKIIHLTMYGIGFEKNKIKNDKVLVVVGGEKVEGEIYKLADYNISVGSQPHSEVGALSVFLYKNFGIRQDFENSKIKIIPSEKGKNVKEI